MNNSPAAQRYVIGPESKPAFTRYTRLHHDRARERFVILAPERAYEVDPIGLAVLRLCDGHRSLADIAAHLAQI
jgi:pyrroloquinoline quinone biosynthesis protein E